MVGKIRKLQPVINGAKPFGNIINDEYVATPNATHVGATTRHDEGRKIITG